MSTKAHDLVPLLDLVNADAFVHDEAGRVELVAAAQRMLSRLQTPHEISLGFANRNPCLLAAIRVFIDLGIWKAWREKGGGSQSLESLVAMANTQCDSILLERLLRLLVAGHTLGQVDVNVYTPTDFSLSLGDEDAAVDASLITGMKHSIPAAMNLPHYLAKTGYQNPTVPHANYLDAFPGQGHFWARNAADPAANAAFVRVMAQRTRVKQPWTAAFDVRALAAGAALPPGGAPLVVDVGGGGGDDLALVRAALPALPPGALVLQDQAHVVAAAAPAVAAGVTAMAHDFFTAQPVHGSRAYFLHCVLHDWPDADAIRILENLKPAMKRGYSKLLVFEIGLPAIGATIEQAAMDVSMMAMYSASERTDADWHRLFDAAGFRIVKVWKNESPASDQSENVYEAELK